MENRYEVTGKIDGTNVTYGWSNDRPAAEQLLKDAKASAFFTDARLIDREAPEGDAPEADDAPAPEPKKKTRPKA